MESLVPENLIRRADAPQVLKEMGGPKYSPKTLARYAHDGTGPAYYRIGREVFYAREDLKSWLRGKIKKRGAPVSA